MPGLPTSGNRKSRRGSGTSEEDDGYEEDFDDVTDAEDPSTPLKAEMEMANMRRGNKGDRYEGREAFGDRTNNDRRLPGGYPNPHSKGPNSPEDPQGEIEALRARLA